jgi:hypothetical protein
MIVPLTLLDYFMCVMVISSTIRCGVEQWQLVGLITRRSQVQVLPPLLSIKGHNHTVAAFYFIIN